MTLAARHVSSGVIIGTSAAAICARCPASVPRCLNLSRQRTASRQDPGAPGECRRETLTLASPGQKIPFIIDRQRRGPWRCLGLAAGNLQASGDSRNRFLARPPIERPAGPDTCQPSAYQGSGESWKPDHNCLRQLQERHQYEQPKRERFVIQFHGSKFRRRQGDECSTSGHPRSARG